jgi:hypothetical protein
LIRLERFTEFVSAAYLDEDIELRRDALMTEVVYTLQKIVAALHEQRNERRLTQFRMADFADFAIKIGPVLGVEQRQVEEILRKVADVQQEFTIQDDPLLAMLDDWLQTPRNVGRWVRTAELFEYQQRNGRFSGSSTVLCKDARALGQAITNLRSTLESIYGFQEQIRGQGVRWVRFNKCRSPASPHNSDEDLVELTG